ncbi:hypothetical protein L7F22_020296 [Adiantum nelumboides]|nr:hypothetical protein [Adiantum nelumboides]
MKDCRRQTLQVALHATWIAGLLCFVVSLYATQLLVGKTVHVQKAALRLTLTIFTVPFPFEGKVGEFQAQAIYSWLRLSSHFQVVLLGEHPSLITFADKMGGRVTVDSDIDFTFSGAPLFNSIMARACSSTSEISVLIDPQFLLIENFLDTLEHAHSLQHSWLLVAIAKSIEVFPFTIDIFNDRWVNEDNQTVQDVEVHAYARRLGSWRGCKGKYLWAWSTETVPLHAGVMPSFVYGFDFYHEWLLNEALSSGTRFVFDASEAILAFYFRELESNYPYDEGHWEAENNARLATLYGSFYFRPADFVNTPVKLIRCGNANLKVFQFLYPSFDLKASGKEEVSSFSEDVESQFQPWNKSFLSSFRRLRKLRVTSYIIGAVDTQLYEFGLLQGLPVFMSVPGMDLSFNDCHFGTECFKKVTKVKSRQLWHKVINGTSQAPNKPRRLNSGFYFVWPNTSTIAAFEMIVKHASMSNMSEQPSFYDVLCGQSGQHRVGGLLCLELETNVTTHFSNRDLFPNGAFKELWERRNVSEACILQGCFVLHNNWVSGRSRKFARQIASGLWDHDVTNRICLRNWQS